jgi:hypothetical protein
VDDVILYGRYICLCYFGLVPGQRKTSLMVPLSAYGERLLCFGQHVPEQTVPGGCLPPRWSDVGI